jgi:hypothetical protein
MPMMTFEVTDEEKEVILKAAREKRGMTVSDFIRSCIYLELVCSGDLQAIRLLGGRFRRRTATALRLISLPGLRKRLAE